MNPNAIFILFALVDSFDAHAHRTYETNILMAHLVSSLLSYRLLSLEKQNDRRSLTMHMYRHFQARTNKYSKNFYFAFYMWDVTHFLFFIYYLSLHVSFYISRLLHIAFVTLSFGLQIREKKTADLTRNTAQPQWKRDGRRSGCWNHITAFD